MCISWNWKVFIWILEKSSEIWLIKFKNIILTWSGKVFKGTVVIWALSFLHGGSLEINLIGFKYCQVSQSLSFYLNNLNFVKESNQLRVVIKKAYFFVNNFFAWYISGFAQIAQNSLRFMLKNCAKVCKIKICGKIAQILRKK